jgi:methylase of polypeptide subunit release factors
VGIDLEEFAAEQAAHVASKLRRAAERRGTEADFRREVARILDEVGEKTGLTIVPRDEFSVARGRVDSVYNRLILEYKRPGILRNNNYARPNQEVIQQVKGYIQDVATREKRGAHRLAGVATDGQFFIFVRKVGEGWSVDDPAPISKDSVEHFLRLLFALSAGAALVPENLVEDFGPKTIRAQRAVRSIYATLHSSKVPLVQKLFDQWRMFFSEATDYKEWSESIENKPEFRTFVKGMGLDPKYAEAPKVFFALHTYYALLIKLVASLAAARFAGGKSAPLSNMAKMDSESLKNSLIDLERGGLFREYGIRNFLEGDFFGWYLAAWNHDIDEAVRGLVKRLAEYDPGTLELAPENARDLLKKLYHYLLPREIRHDLGEYYTPDWLAERLIRQTLGDADLGNATRRVLDPSCGSGTFLVLLIKHIRDRMERNKRDPKETLQLILQNIVGIDLNPLAVIAARTNYLLALGDLLKHRTGDIDIPVYQADSVLTPAQGTSLFDGDVYPLKTSVGVFRVPTLFAQKEKMEALANTLDSAVEDHISQEAFLSRLRQEAKLDNQELGATKKDIRVLHKQLADLHDQGLNGVWARIIKNSFAPLFLEGFHYIVGNPPWVNWEHLPDEYRRSTMKLWEHYGLFPKREKALETILGAAKYDISMLMTCVAADKYLKRAGKLGFVLTQTVFKTTGAGQGFRRFILPDKVPFGPLVVEDMVKLKPFEGASNRTAVVVFAKGHEVRYPVQYQEWMKKRAGRSGSIAFDTPYEEVTGKLITFKALHAEPVDPLDQTSAWLTASPRILKVLRRIHGDSGYVARKGVYCSANGVFWLDLQGSRPDGHLIVSNLPDEGRIKVTRTQATIEADLVYPLLRGRDVGRWQAAPKSYVLLTHKEGMRLKAIPEREMQENYPKAWRYLFKFKNTLQKTGLFRRFCKPDDPFYSMFNIGDYTFSPWKLVIREISAALTCAVVGDFQGKAVIPDHKLVIVAGSNKVELHYLCAMLNSLLARFFVGSYCIETQFSSHILHMLNIPRFKGNNKLHLRLSGLSVAAHQAVSQGNKDELDKSENEIDLLSAELWGLQQDELVEIKKSLEEG